MIQTGDPTGGGTGGTSIWGHEFEDEFHPNLKHDKPFPVSQFFITVIPCVSRRIF
jgi:peptidylprolyl isomerase domain and WD repeat-containing protein 1